MLRGLQTAKVRDYRFMSSFRFDQIESGATIRRGSPSKSLIRGIQMWGWCWDGSMPLNAGNRRWDALWKHSRSKRIDLM